jgi:hypothetical protein
MVNFLNPLCPTLGDHAYKLPKSQGVLAFTEYYSVLFSIGMREPYGSLGNLSQLARYVSHMAHLGHKGHKLLHINLALTLQMVMIHW